MKKQPQTVKRYHVTFEKDGKQETEKFTETKVAEGVRARLLSGWAVVWMTYVITDRYDGTKII